MIISFRAKHEPEMILAIIIMLIHMVFTELKPPKWLIDGRRCQLLPQKAAGLLDLMIQECSLGLHTAVAGSIKDAVVSFSGRRRCLRNLTLPLSFLQHPEKTSKA